MLHLAVLFFGSDEIFSNPANGLWAFLTISAVVLFGVFLPLVTWMDSRRKEREAFYRAETFRRLAEASGEGAKGALELLREQDRQQRVKIREGMKMGGVITLGVGVGMVIFLRAVTGSGQGAPYLVGLIPGLIGVAMLVYVYFMAPPVD